LERELNEKKAKRKAANDTARRPLNWFVRIVYLLFFGFPLAATVAGMAGPKSDFTSARSLLSWSS
jgi:hypothetical protein